MQRAVAVIIVVLILGLSWFLVSPLFIDREVDESLEYTRPDGSIDVDRVLAMQDEERQALRKDIMETAAAIPDLAAEEPMPPLEPEVIASGVFVDADAIHKGSGEAAIYALPDGRRIVRFENFRTTNGPALVVYLAKHPSPADADDVIDNGFLSLGKLKGNVGNQNYEIPADVDISEYKSVVIWCELFGVLFSPATLAPTV